MKVYLDYEPDETGKGKFLRRLEAALKPMGVSFTHKQKGADVALGISRWRNSTNLPKVLRIDGIRVTFDKKGKWYNRIIKKSMKASEHVVFQSKFAHRYVATHLCSPQSCSVIHNGVDTKRAAKHDKYWEQPNVLLMVGNWGGKKLRKHKRLKRMVKFTQWFLGKHEDWIAVVAGQTPWHPHADRLVYTGHVDDDDLLSILKSGAAMLNLSDLDWCPNATVEALAAGCPVVGFTGTAIGELLSTAGTPSLSQDATDAAIEHAILNAEKPDSRWFDIEHAAKAYKEVFESVRR
jgi:glycosyltransferase involved in cell wall biosynthesis